MKKYNTNTSALEEPLSQEALMQCFASYNVQLHNIYNSGNLTLLQDFLRSAPFISRFLMHNLELPSSFTLLYIINNNIALSDPCPIHRSSAIVDNLNASYQTKLKWCIRLVLLLQANISDGFKKRLSRHLYNSITNLNIYSIPLSAPIPILEELIQQSIITLEYPLEKLQPAFKALIFLCDSFLEYPSAPKRHFSERLKQILSSPINFTTVFQQILRYSNGGRLSTMLMEQIDILSTRDTNGNTLFEQAIFKYHDQPEIVNRFLSYPPLTITHKCHILQKLLFKNFFVSPEILSVLVDDNALTMPYNNIILQDDVWIEEFPPNKVTLLTSLFENLYINIPDAQFISFTTIIALNILLKKNTAGLLREWFISKPHLLYNKTSVISERVTLLHGLCQYKIHSAIKLLLSINCIYINAFDRNWCTPLRNLVMYTNSERSIILRSEAPVSEEEERSMIKDLINHGAEPCFILPHILSRIVSYKFHRKFQPTYLYWDTTIHHFIKTLGILIKRGLLPVEIEENLRDHQPDLLNDYKTLINRLILKEAPQAQITTNNRNSLLMKHVVQPARIKLLSRKLENFFQSLRWPNFEVNNNSRSLYKLRKDLVSLQLVCHKFRQTLHKIIGGDIVIIDYIIIMICSPLPNPLEKEDLQIAEIIQNSCVEDNIKQLYIEALHQSRGQFYTQKMLDTPYKYGKTFLSNIKGCSGGLIS